MTLMLLLLRSTAQVVPILGVVASLYIILPHPTLTLYVILSPHAINVKRANGREEGASTMGWESWLCNVLQKLHVE